MGSKGQLDVICSALAFAGLVGCGGATADAGTDADSSATTAATRDVTDTQSSGSETGDDTDASAGACGPPPAVTGEAALSEVTFPNARGELITAVLQVPEGAEGRPAVIVLHGSG
ncbi:MAG: hypothetical protein KC636_08230, partial [Myxococcales bacterium]|nr:hypothetical protein [Myxococcales bacterium]